MRKLLCFMSVMLLCGVLVCCAQADPTLKLYPSEDVNYYIGLTFDGHSPVYSANSLFNVSVADPASLIAAYGDTFQWTVKQTGGDPVNFKWENGSWGTDYRAIYGYLVDMPGAVTTATFEITCAIGSQQEMQTVTANFLSVPLPTGVDGIPTDIDAQVNTPLSLNPQILPQGWSLQGYQLREFFEGVADFAPKYD